MRNIFKTPNIKTNQFGNVHASTKTTDDFKYLIGHNINDIILFEDGNEELLEQGHIILPRHYFIFVGYQDDIINYKPYEFNPYRIVVTTYKNIITHINSIG